MYTDAGGGGVIGREKGKGKRAKVSVQMSDMCNICKLKLPKQNCVDRYIDSSNQNHPNHHR